MDERLRFVARVLDGEKMAALCREFDISRKTGYKIFNRYKDSGLEGLTDRSRRPRTRLSLIPMRARSAALSPVWFVATGRVTMVSTPPRLALGSAPSEADLGG